MFLLEQKTLMVLMVAFGILLQAVYIQPTTPAGLKCHVCNPCEDSSPGEIKQCDPRHICGGGEKEFPNGTKILFRECINGFPDHPCDKFTTLEDGTKVRTCWCQKPLCNEKDYTKVFENGDPTTPAPGPTSSASSPRIGTQLLFASLSVLCLLK